MRMGPNLALDVKFDAWDVRKFWHGQKPMQFCATTQFGTFGNTDNDLKLLSGLYQNSNNNSR